MGFESLLLFWWVVSPPVFPSDRVGLSAPWPPPEGQLRVIIDTDAANEVDDQYALALALGFPDRFKIEGIVAAHYGDIGGSKGIERSRAEVERVLEHAGMAGRFPIKNGADPLTYVDRPPKSEGIDFIIETAKTATADDPLWLILLGPATDGVAALLQEPTIADRLVIFWHVRSDWPRECLNFNAQNDVKAARLLFELPCRFVMFDTGAHLRMNMEESEQRIRRNGRLGNYLHEIRKRKPHFATAHKGMFDLGDVAALVAPQSARFERVATPQVDLRMQYDFSQPQGDVVRITDVDRDRSFELLEESLKRLEARGQKE